MRHFTFRGWGLLGVVLGLGGGGSLAWADSALVQWKSGPSANDSYFQRIDRYSASTPLTFQAAAADAAAMTYEAPGGMMLRGQLAVFDSNYSDAFTFVRDNVVYGATGTGPAPSNEIYWVGASSPTGNSAPNDSNLSDWKWVNGRPVPDSIVTTWNIDHYEGAGPEGAGYFQSTSGQLWDYISTSSSNLAYGYVVQFLPCIPGDVNCDGVVNFSDLLTLAQNYGKSGGWSQGHFDGTGTVDFADLLTLAQNYGKTSGQASMSPAPEPAAGTLALLVPALLARRRTGAGPRR